MRLSARNRRERHIDALAQRNRAREQPRSGGDPLPGRVRADMESRFGHDFETVRVHSDRTAAGSAARLNAQAYTLNEHIVLGSGVASDARRELLAHELAHVVQQRLGRGQPPCAAGAVEAEADEAARRIGAGGTVRIQQAAPAAEPLRKPRSGADEGLAPRVRQNLFGDQESWYVLDGFATKKAELTASHESIIARVARDLASNPPGPGGYVRIVGHADQVPSKDPDNAALGQQRAVAVRDALVEALGGKGVADLDIRAASLGTQVPAVRTPGAEPRNRRVTITITRKTMAPVFTFEPQRPLAPLPGSIGRVGPIAPFPAPGGGLAGPVPGPLVPRATPLPLGTQQVLSKAGATGVFTLEGLARWLIEHMEGDAIARFVAAIPAADETEKAEIKEDILEAITGGGQAGLEALLKLGLEEWLGPGELEIGVPEGEKIIKSPEIPIPDPFAKRVDTPRLRAIGRNFPAGGFIKFAYSTATLVGPGVRIEVLPKTGNEPVRDSLSGEPLRVIVRPGVRQMLEESIHAPETPGIYRLRMRQDVDEVHAEIHVRVVGRK